MRENRAERKERERWERERERKNARRRRRRSVGGVIALIIILAFGFAVLRAWMETRPGGADPIVVAGSDELDDKNRVNILFMGTNQGLTDTIMVFSYDMGNNVFDQISIPRDTYYYRPAYAGAAYQKINSVYETEGYEGACQAVSDVLCGIPVHYYAVLAPEGVKKIVDAMGGIVMDVPFDMQYSDPDQDLYIDLQAGTQRLTGDQAMQYLRYRSGYANGDLGRVSAQQEFLKAVMSQSSGMDYPKIALAASSVTKTNISLTSGLGLVTKAMGKQGGTFVTHTIPGSAGMKDGLSYFFHDEAGTEELVRSLYAG